MFFDGVFDDYDKKGMLVEVFDSVSQKFAFFKRKLTCLDPDAYFSVNLISIGSKIYIFDNNRVSSYDVEKDEFSEELLKIIKNVNAFGCTILPQLEF